MKDEFEILLPESLKVDDLDIRPISGWFDEWVTGIKEEKNKISLKFPVYDHEMRGKLRGKLGVIIHYGGTKKSLLSQNIAHFNIFFNQHRVIYSSMEMGVVELGSRFINLAVDYEESTESASEILEKTYKTNPAFVIDLLINRVATAYGDWLQITQNSGLTCDGYKTLLERVETHTGSVDILIVDGLSMMGGKGTELELANTHTRGL